jgi:hypothetical protein
LVVFSSFKFILDKFLSSHSRFFSKELLFQEFSQFFILEIISSFEEENKSQIFIEKLLFSTQLYAISEAKIILCIFSKSYIKS